MRSFIYLAVSAFAALAAAQDAPNQFKNPASGYSFKAGSATTLNWQPTTSGTVTLKLQWGGVTTADSGITIAQSIPNSGTYSWTPDADLAPEPDYTIEIVDDADTSKYNFLPRFVIAGVTGSATTSAASKTDTASTTATSASAASTTLSTVTTSSASSSASSGTSSSPSSSASSSSSSKATAKSTAASTTTAAASSSSSAASSTSTTSAPNANAGVSMKVPAGLMAVVMGVMAAM